MRLINVPLECIYVKNAKLILKNYLFLFDRTYGYKINGRTICKFEQKIKTGCKAI